MRRGGRQDKRWDRASVKRTPIREQTCTCAHARVSRAVKVAGEADMAICLTCVKPVSPRRVAAKIAFLNRRLCRA